MCIRDRLWRYKEMAALHQILRQPHQARRNYELALSLQPGTGASALILRNNYGMFLADLADDLEGGLAELEAVLANSGTSMHRIMVKANIGLLHYRRGDLDLAIQSHKQALELKRQAYGSGHPAVAVTHFNMALVHLKRCQIILDQDSDHTRVLLPMQAVLTQLQEAFSIQRLTPGMRHGQTVETMAELCKVMLFLETSVPEVKEGLEPGPEHQLLDLEGLLRESLEPLKQRIAPDKVASHLYVLGHIRNHSQDGEGCVRDYRAALSMCLPDEPGSVLQLKREILYGLLMALSQLGRFNEAEQLWKGECQGVLDPDQVLDWVVEAMGVQLRMLAGRAWDQDLVHEWQRMFGGDEIEMLEEATIMLHDRARETNQEDDWRAILVCTGRWLELEPEGAAACWVLVARSYGLVYFGKRDEALGLAPKLVELGEREGDDEEQEGGWVAYSVACYFAAFSQTYTQAFEWLRVSIDRGVDIEHVSSDEDLRPLHGALFDELLGNQSPTSRDMWKKLRLSTHSTHAFRCNARTGFSDDKRVRPARPWFLG
eukprot:TRINITY_DN2388_c0_g8_i2.p1 TRINITY_DN2388_c0_g8~~TRINITY_DN2388_c0_g8_i2.p1  ORF type:complete len:543 (-),score=117.92 TRINITY_DN2388_c0_g8_i2:113-1741(-)